MIRVRHFALAALLAPAAFLTTSAQASLLIEMKFNEIGTTAFNTAPGQYDSDGNGTMASINDGAMAEGAPWNQREPADRHSADGTGVSGLPGDRAFDAGGPNGAVIINSIPGVWVGQDFTVSGWLKTSDDTAWGGDAGVTPHLGWGMSGSSNQFRIRESGTANTPELFIASNHEDIGETGSDTYAADMALWTQTEAWVFWAVSFEGSAASDTDRVKFYAGTTEDSVSLVATADGPSRTVALGDSLFWAQDTSMASGFSGLMDNLRFHDEAISLADLEQLRAVDAIPEPASLVLLSAGAACLIARRRRRG